MSAKLEMRALRAGVRPVVFETGLAEFPLSTAGTAFLLSDRSRTFVVTAKHVLRGYPPERLRIYPSFDSEKFLRISEFYNVNAESPGEEIEDFIVLKIDGISSQSRSPITLPPNHENWHAFEKLRTIS